MMFNVIFIALSGLLRIPVSDYSFGVFKLFCQQYFSYIVAVSFNW